MPHDIKVPTLAEFKSLTGRASAGRVFKRKSDLNPVFSALESFGPFARSIGPEAIARVRAVRRACIAWLGANAGSGRSSRPAVEDLLARTNARFLALCEMSFAGADRGSDVSKSAALAAKPKLGKGVIGSELQDDQALEAARSAHWGGRGAGLVMTNAFDAYRKNGGSLTTAAFAKHVYLPNAEDDPGGKFLGAAAFDNMARRIQEGVKYCTEPERGAYRLQISGGLIHDAGGSVFDTSARHTEASGYGWAIFVLGLDGEVYANSHELDLFHHSSFFAGHPVACGGELCVIAGALRYITAKTGHYQSQLPEFMKALRQFHTRGIDLRRVLACPLPHEDKQFYRASEVLAQRGTAGSDGGARPKVTLGAQRGAGPALPDLTPILTRFPARSETPCVPEWPAARMG